MNVENLANTYPDGHIKQFSLKIKISNATKLSLPSPTDIIGDLAYRCWQDILNNIFFIKTFHEQGISFHGDTSE